MALAPTGSNDIFVVALALFGTVWAIFALPFAFHVIRAVLAGNAWLPFEPNANGRYTFMAQNRLYAAFRAPQAGDRTTFGLVVRYVVWLWAIAALSYLPAKYLTHLLTH